MTRSASFTITDARYVGAKIGADLRVLHNLYNKPASLDQIDNYVEEIAQLLKRGYLDTVDYGFRDSTSNLWKLRLRYRATIGGQLTDSSPGRLPRAVVAGSPFYSFLSYSSAFNNLSATEKTAFKKTLPITRSTAEEPGIGLGSTAIGHGYGRNGVGVTRDIFTALEP
jgi:hypothetical protein